MSAVCPRCGGLFQIVYAPIGVRLVKDEDEEEEEDAVRAYESSIAEAYADEGKA
jgi:hypothetical protein